MQVPTFPNTQHMRYSVEGSSHPTFWRESEATVGSLAGRVPDDNGERVDLGHVLGSLCYDGMRTKS